MRRDRADRARACARRRRDPRHPSRPPSTSSGTEDKVRRPRANFSGYFCGARSLQDRLMNRWWKSVTGPLTFDTTRRVSRRVSVPPSRRSGRPAGRCGSAPGLARAEARRPGHRYETSGAHRGRSSPSIERPLRWTRFRGPIDVVTSRKVDTIARTDNTIRRSQPLRLGGLDESQLRLYTFCQCPYPLAPPMSPNSDKWATWLEPRWLEDAPAERSRRVYSADEVARLRGRFSPEHTTARLGAERLWR